MTSAGEHRAPLRLATGLLAGPPLLLLPGGGVRFRGHNDWVVHGTWSTAWSAVLQLKRGGGIHAVVVWRHRQDAGAFRRLSVLCQHGFAASP